MMKKAASTSTASSALLLVSTTLMTNEKMALRKGMWSPEEDQKLIDYINRYGIWNWAQMPKAAGLSRTGKSCRLRWMNYLRPGIKRGNFSNEEVQAILHLHQMLGNRWSLMAARLPGRTDNDIKNYWNTHLKKGLKNSMTNTLVQRTKKMQAPIDVESKLMRNNISSDENEITVSKVTNTSVVSQKDHDQYSTPNFSSSTPLVCEISKKQVMIEENNNIGACGPSGSELTTLLRQQSFSTEGLLLEEECGASFSTTDPALWIHESPNPYHASIDVSGGSDFWVNCI